MTRLGEEKQEIWDALRAPFPPEQIDQLPKGGTRLDYVGHAAVTDRMLKVDPLWNWEPVAFDDRGLPAFTLNSAGNPVGLWIKLTIAGVTRLGFGSVVAGAFDAEKQLIGDAIRNAAMRFGVALDLWSKSDLHDQKANPPAQLPPVDVPEWVEPFNSQRKLRGITPADIAQVIGASGTISNIEAWLAKDAQRTPDKLLSLAADAKVTA